MNAERAADLDPQSLAGQSGDVFQFCVASGFELGRADFQTGSPNYDDRGLRKARGIETMSVTESEEEALVQSLWARDECLDLIRCSLGMGM